MENLNIFPLESYSFALFEFFCVCMNSPVKKKRNTLINSNTNYRREMKLMPVNMDYCLLQFDALIFFLGVHLHGRSVPNFNFFNVNPKFHNEILKFTIQIAWIQIFTTFLTLV